MANTTNLNLVKPAGTDYALVSVINGNMDIIDSKVGAIPANESAQSQITALNNQITTTTTMVTRRDVTTNIRDYADSIEAGTQQFFRMRCSEPTSAYNYSAGVIYRQTTTDTMVVMYSKDGSEILTLTKASGTWDNAWKYYSDNSKYNFQVLYPTEQTITMYVNSFMAIIVFSGTKPGTYSLPSGYSYNRYYRGVLKANNSSNYARVVVLNGNAEVTDATDANGSYYGEVVMMF